MAAGEAMHTRQMVSPYKVLVVIYVSAARSGTLGKYARKTYRCGGRGVMETIHYWLKCLGAKRLSFYPELLLQAQPVVGSPGVVKPVQMALQRAHIQLGVSVQEVLQQSLVDEGVLHLRERRHQRGGRSLVLSNSLLLFWHHRHGSLFPLPRLVCAATAASGFSCQSEEPGGREGSALTSVWMSWQRCSRIRLTEPKTSTLCSTCIMSIMLSMTINVPVLPTPALRRGNNRHLVTNTETTPEHFVTRKHEVGAETFPLGAVADSSELV